MKLLLGQTLEFTADPFEIGVEAARHRSSGGVLVGGGKIVEVGEAEDLRQRFPQAEITNYGSHLISAGFVDAHAHYPQTSIIASWGKRLIDWLNSYTFPEEMRFGDPDYASVIANRYLDLILAHGTTSVTTFCTIHPESVDAIFEAAAARGMAIAAGKVAMDRNAPDGLRDDPQTAYDQSKALIDRWHGAGRASYAIAPRFSPTSTPEQLAMMGALWAERPNCLMQTHLSEQTDEVEWVRGLFPDARDYLDTYEQAGLLREGGLFGHAIYLTERERDRLRETGASVVHCPTSNTFIGSGLFDMDGLTRQRIKVGLATDTGGGSSFSMLRTMAAAYEIGQLRGRPLHASELWWLATEGSARAMRMQDRIGTLAPGSDADLIVVNLASTPAISQRSNVANDFWESLFPTIMMGDDRAIGDVWVGGERIAAAD
jgi:guanine deaminase